MTQGPTILNNRLRWDGSQLGSYIGAITHQWTLEGTRYYGITLPTGIIYCTATCTKSTFPCIVEDIKEIFGVRRRGVHRITIDNREYILYYVPISIKGEVVWETPLNRLDGKHTLRKDPQFRKEVQKVIAFCDILALASTGEPAIRIRPGSDGNFVPISINETATTISKANDYDYSILTKTLFSKWFGEETSINDIVKEMTHYQSNLLTSQPKIPIVRGTNGVDNNLTVISSEIRNKIDEIIKRYDRDYIWYSCFIADRMSRHLLVDS